MNRLKKSLSLDLKTSAGREILLGMAEKADILIEGFRPGVMSRLGLDWPTLKECNPRLIMVSLSGFGQLSPLSQIAAHDLNIVGLSGALDLSGDPRSEPAIPALPLADIGGGSLMAVIAIFAALRQRDATGEGQYADISMLDGLTYWLSPPYFQSLARGKPPQRGIDPLLGGAAWYRAYRTACGGAMVVGAYEPKFWKAFCETVGIPEFIPIQFGDRDTQSMMMNRLEALFLSRSRDEWTALFEGIDCCVTPVLDLLEAMDSAHARARSSVVADISPQGSHLCNPVRLSGVSPRETTPPPELGEHSDEVLAAFGYDDAEITRLRKAGVV